MNTSHENTITFKYLEKELFKYACEEALNIFYIILPTLKGKISYQDSFLTLGRKAIKKIFNLKDFSQMSLSF